jgi:hypothetical protein
MADFKKNFPAWQKAVAAGTKTPDDLLAMLSTKATFTDAQKAAVLALKPAQAPKAEPAAEEAKPDPAFVAGMEDTEGAPF